MSNEQFEHLLTTLAQATAELVQSNRQQNTKIDQLTEKIDRLANNIDVLTDQIGRLSETITIGNQELREAITIGNQELREVITVGNQEFRAELVEIKETSRQQAETARLQADSISRLITLLESRQ